jgi:hypothetical protein
VSTTLRSPIQGWYNLLQINFSERTVSSELFIAEILLYNIGIPIERQFGTLKFAVRAAKHLCEIQLTPDVSHLL